MEAITIEIKNLNRFQKNTLSAERKIYVLENGSV